mmetsp:Transcript_15308/g.25272  ORF Transcript_15308/g.25272 Transcript_15308/m.25272 type:complete len:217 (+) Transcript_15308:1528-2178(+)
MASVGFVIAPFSAVKLTSSSFVGSNSLCRQQKRVASKIQNEAPVFVCEHKDDGASRRRFLSAAGASLLAGLISQAPVMAEAGASPKIRIFQQYFGEEPEAPSTYIPATPEEIEEFKTRIARFKKYLVNAEKKAAKGFYADTRADLRLTADLRHDLKAVAKAISPDNSPTFESLKSSLYSSLTEADTAARSEASETAKAVGSALESLEGITSLLGGK